MFQPHQENLTFVHAGAVEDFGFPDGIPVLLTLRLKNTCNNRTHRGEESHLRTKAELQMRWASSDL